MKILALEFSSKERSAAVASSARSGFKLLSSVVEQDAASVTGMSLVDAVIEMAELTPEQIDVIAIGLGPGSYGGIRAAIAIAQGWELGRGTRLLGISSMDLLAREAQRRQLSGEITAVVNAQRGEFYTASYLVSPDEVRPLGRIEIKTPEQLDHSRLLIGPAAGHHPGGIEMFPSAMGLAALARAGSGYVMGEKLEPIYLRTPSFVKAPPTRFGHL